MIGFFVLFQLFTVFYPLSIQETYLGIFLFSCIHLSLLESPKQMFHDIPSRYKYYSDTVLHTE